jgi:hypothetical protein
MAPPQMIGHVVLYPGPGPHRAVRMGDVMLLLADTITSVRMQSRMVVDEPLGRIDGCAACVAAYAEAKQIIEQAGGVETWAIVR